MCWNPFYVYLVVLSQFVKRQYYIKGSFILYFGVVKGHNCSQGSTGDEILPGWGVFKNNMPGLGLTGILEVFRGKSRGRDFFT